MAEIGMTVIGFATHRTLARLAPSPARAAASARAPAGHGPRVPARSA
jgi:hypothetical protein